MGWGRKAKYAAITATAITVLGLADEAVLGHHASIPTAARSGVADTHRVVETFADATVELLKSNQNSKVNNALALPRVVIRGVEGVVWFAGGIVVGTVRGGGKAGADLVHWADKKFGP